MGNKFAKGRPKIVVKKSCAICYREYIASPSRISEKFCSNKCSGIGRQKNPPKQVLENLYVVQKMSTTSIGKIYGVGNTSVGKWLKKFGIKTILGRGGAKKGNIISEEQREKIRQSHLKKKEKHHLSGRRNPMLSKGINPRQYSEVKAGYRKDIKASVRSSWEANIYRYLLHLKKIGKILGHRYEKETFIFYGENERPYSYTPDFKVKTIKGIYYLEVKGCMTEMDLAKILRMKKHYPDTVVKFITETEYKEIRSKYAKFIPKWERPNPPSIQKYREMARIRREENISKEPMGI